MNIGDQQTYERHREAPTAVGEVLFAMLVFGSMGAITWAIRGTSGWGGIDGAIVPGMTWGILWWYVCWRKGIDARGVPLWLGLGIALGGELGYGQYVSWIRGRFNAGDDILRISPWVGYVWFAICGMGWGALGGVALGWALAGRKSLGTWLARLVVPLGVAILARLAVQTWPWLFFPNWDLGVYKTREESLFDPATAASAQWHMIIMWLTSALLSVLLCLGIAKIFQPGRAARWVSLCGVGAVIVLSLLVADWLFFPEDQLGLFAGELGHHLGRTVYSNSQNTIVVGWWLGAILIAAVQHDRYVLFVGSVISVGFGIGFPLAATWCLGYVYAPHWIDWWKMWELQSGCHLGLLYVTALYWAIRQVDEHRELIERDGAATFQQWCETLSMALGAAIIIYVMAREEFLTVGILLGLTYVAALIQSTRYSNDTIDRQRAISFIYSAFLLVFIMTWGLSSQAGVLLDLYNADAVDQYAWPPTRIAIFAPAGILISAATLWAMGRVLHDPRASFPPRSNVSRVSARLVDLMTFTGVVGAVSIWPSKIGVLYPCFLALALFAFNRLNGRFDSVDNCLRSTADQQ